MYRAMYASASPSVAQHACDSTNYGIDVCDANDRPLFRIGLR